MRNLPNILLTGTPGTGKTTMAQLICSLTPLEHLNVSDMVKRDGLHDGYDSEFDTYILDDDKVCDALEYINDNGGYLVDFHSSDLFPVEWFDCVIVLRTDNSILYPRLEKRNYSQRKITENIECEIMQVIMEEVYGHFPKEMIVVMQSDSVDEMEANVERTLEWIEMWKKDNSNL